MISKLKNHFRSLDNEQGEVGVWMLIVLVLVILIVIPFVSQTIERYRINILRNDTTTAVEMAMYSTLISLDLNGASAEFYDFDNTEFNLKFREYLALNMNLNPDLSDTASSLVDGDVVINSINYYGSAFLPYTNPNTGKVFTRPYFSVELRLVIMPSLFRKVVLQIAGVEEFYYTFYHDISMPIDN